MTPAEAHKLILQRWIAQWGDETPYAIDNRKLAQPSPPFAMVEIVNLGADQVTMGRDGFRRFERSGFIDVRLYDAAGQGRGVLDELAARVVEIFEAIDITGLRTYATSVTELRGDKEYPDLWCLLCRTPFEFHERR